MLIVNADDWGADRATTARILDCVLQGAVSSVSAMVFMKDSERAAAIARERGIDAGLHLNFTAPFTARGVPAGIAGQQSRISGYLLRHRYAQIVFHPGLAGSFADTVSAQVSEYVRIYGTEPRRIDGHHHMHLCANVLLGRLLPEGTVVRRNFSFAPGEKSLPNRLYRKAVDRALERRHRMADYLFSLAPIDPARLRRVVSLARTSTVELETHPAKPAEYRFLAGGALFQWTRDVEIASGYAIGSGKVQVEAL